MPHIRTATTFLATTLLLAAIACGAEVRLTPAQAQDDPGNAGGTGGEATVGEAELSACDCPSPPPPRKVEFARAECFGGFAVFGVFAGQLEFRDRAYDAWLHPTADETLGQQQALLQWGPEDGAFVRCPLGGEQMTATLWGFE